MHTRTYGSALLAAFIGLGLLHPAAVDGQPWTPSPEAERMTFTFPGDRLEVRVLGVQEGELRLMRGDRGTLRVTGHAPGGIPGIGRSSGGLDRLDLTVTGADRGVFLVIVPENARVRVSLPDGEARQSFDPPRGTVLFRWPAGEEAVGPAADDGPEARGEDGPG